jgi:hypothetical protein
MGTKIAGGGAFGDCAVARALSLVVMVRASVVLPGGLLVSGCRDQWDHE